MKGVKYIIGLLGLLSVTLWLAFSSGAVFASSDGAEHGAAGEQTVAAEAGHVEVAGHGEAHHSSSLSPAKLKDLGWRVVNFIALMIILVKFGAKPIGSGLAARQKKIKDEIEMLQQKRSAAEKSYNEFQTKLSSVEYEIDKIVERAVAQAEIEKVKIIEKAEKATADLKRSAEMAIQNEVTEARRMLKNEVAEQASVMAEQLILKNLTADDQVKIIENYLAKVGAVQ